MVACTGLVGLRPDPAHVATVTAPPYDVIKPGTALERYLQAESDSLYHITLGDHPAEALARLQTEGRLVLDEEPAFYIYEQRFGDQRRIGVFVAPEVSDYRDHQIIRHEKTFDEKVRGRIALSEATGHSFGPVFLLTKARITPLLETILIDCPALYEFTSHFPGGTDLDGIANRIVRVTADSSSGRDLAALLEPHPLYIADGHHRYHAALRYGQKRFLAYVCEEARILAYNRVVRGTVPFAQAKAQLELEASDAFTTPPKHAFRIYDGEQSWLLRARQVPDDVVGRLDCAILERELYPALGLSHDMIMDEAHFDYYPESALDTMQAKVDDGSYDIAIALAPVSIDELMAVADAGLQDSDIVMPEKSTFFAPKILSGLITCRIDR